MSAPKVDIEIPAGAELPPDWRYGVDIALEGGTRCYLVHESGAVVLAEKRADLTDDDLDLDLRLLLVEVNGVVWALEEP